MMSADVSPVAVLMFAAWAVDNPNAVVYFVRDPHSRMVKVGRTGNIEQRMATLRTANPDLQLIATIPGGAQCESDLHLTFAKQRVAGEWFMPDMDMANTIASLVTQARRIEVARAAATTPQSPGAASQPAPVGSLGRAT